MDDHRPAFLFDLDGTLVDSVYQHVLAWHQALTAVGAELSVWRIHRRIGMSGGLLVEALARELDRTFGDDDVERLVEAHSRAFRAVAHQVRPLPGARELLAALTELEVPWAIATSGLRRTAQPNLDLLGVTDATPLVTRDMVRHAKPDPDLFLAAAGLLDVAPARCFVVGDSVWDLLAARRAGALGIGLLSGGYGRDELERSGAYRVFDDPSGMLHSLDELGVRRRRA
jgi:HAD superfamily hydrolase (TIGR01509 family)